ncbi:hypothetical protein QBC38DRAFT_485331 [Podospora fimiseda]|uniref:Uncharacterized protein n=1 Tax=Podospora fimiseda TaxID=252190 RepID=A0AAN7BJU2_9PEZI|nr:hypothetical protein QBC38DRAFT_485331 [Podospora fimiseda]
MMTVFFPNNSFPKNLSPTTILTGSQNLDSCSIVSTSSPRQCLAPTPTPNNNSNNNAILAALNKVTTLGTFGAIRRIENPACCYLKTDNEGELLSLTLPQYQLRQGNFTDSLEVSSKLISPPPEFESFLDKIVPIIARDLGINPDVEIEIELDKLCVQGRKGLVLVPDKIPNSGCREFLVPLLCFYRRWTGHYQSMNGRTMNRLTSQNGTKAERSSSNTRDPQHPTRTSASGTVPKTLEIRLAEIDEASMAKMKRTDQGRSRQPFPFKSSAEGIIRDIGDFAQLTRLNPPDFPEGSKAVTHKMLCSFHFHLFLRSALCKVSWISEKDLFQTFSKRVVNDAKEFSTTQYTTPWVPFLAHTLGYLNLFVVDLEKEFTRRFRDFIIREGLEREYQEMFSVVFKSYHFNYVGREPRGNGKEQETLERDERIGNQGE